MKIGITGGMGCGKSTVAGIFGELGFTVIDTDEVGHGLLEEESVQAAIRGHFGEKVFGAKEIDRKRLGELVFSLEENLRFLEDLLHPAIISEYLSMFEGSPGGDFVVQIPLLFEKKLENHFDYVICITCNDDVIEERLKKRGFSSKEIQSRTRFQLPPEEKAARADFVIENNHTIEDLKKSVISLIQKLK